MYLNNLTKKLFHEKMSLFYAVISKAKWSELEIDHHFPMGRTVLL